MVTVVRHQSIWTSSDTAGEKGWRGGRKPSKKACMGNTKLGKNTVWKPFQSCIIKVKKTPKLNMSKGNRAKEKVDYVAN